MAPMVTVTVTDAVTNEIVPNPTFTTDGNPAFGGCAQLATSDAGADASDAGDAGAPLCESWRFQLPVGHSTFVVSATGYQPQSFAFDTQMSGGCCSTGTQLTQPVALTH